MNENLNRHHIKKGIAPDIKLIIKSASRYFIPLTLFTFAIVLGFYFFSMHQDLRAQKAKEKSRLENYNNLILVAMEPVIGDLLSVSDKYALHEYTESKDPEVLSEIEQGYLSFCRHQKIYDQIRYVDETGKEIVRINHRKEKPYIVPKSRLQNKKDRYYFTETIKLPKGSIYVSPFDLNVENGQIEVPIKPTIRFGTPVYNNQGEIKGAVFLNYKGKVLLDRLSSAVLEGSCPSMLIDKQGYWLCSANAEMNWGFMYEDRKNLRFGNKLPDEWKIISKEKQGQFKTREGLFTYRKVYPLTKSVFRGHVRRQGTHHFNEIFDHTQYYWIAVSHIPPLELAQRNAHMRRGVIVLLLLLTATYAIVSLSYARSKIADRLSIGMIEDIAKLNESLIASSLVISEQMDFTDTLQQALASAMRLSNARYGALAIMANGKIEEFIVNGMLEEEKEKAKGAFSNNELLKRHMVNGESIRLSDVSKHPDVSGFTSDHSNIKTLLAVPLTYHNEVMGALYLADKIENRMFTEQDQKIIEAFAAHIAAAQKRAALYEEIKLGAGIFNNSIDGICITDADGNIVKVNSAFTSITGYRSDEVVGRNPRILKSDRHDESFYTAMWEALLEYGSWEGEIWNRRKNRETYPEWLSISAIKNSMGQTENYVAVFHDISEVKQSQERLEYQANHDALTGLPNRQLFSDRLSMALIRAKRHNLNLGLLFLDLDDFKNVNDSLGHLTGDLLLKGVADRLKKNCRAEDTVARLGGDEFIVLMSDLEDPERKTVSLAQRIIRTLEKPFQLLGNEVNTRTSIGITIFPDDGDSAADLIKFADLAMYKAKNEGKNRYTLFTDEMNKKMIRRVSLEADLRRALQRNEMFLCFQPKINLETGLLCGAEALIRWNRNRNELIPPNDFIPLAEEISIISKIGEWVLYQACQQVQVWQDLGFRDLSVSVNLSAKQLRDCSIQNTVENVLTATGIPPELLTLEITENVMVHDVETTISIMERIAGLGVHWSMDDFGTGYSSMRYLQRLPLNEMKIDKSFVDDIPGNKANESIVYSTITLAHSFNLKVVAEGIEEHQQLQFLSACGCNEGQGYLFSKPLKPERFREFIEQHGTMNWNSMN
jgi:diguanylate cyclase (GGDEF)-like protein/PAS domain S-box-containing protein